LESAKDRSQSFAEQAAANLGRLGDGGSVRLLTRGLSHPHPRVRRLAARSLGELGSQASHAAPALRKALQDKDEQVRRVAAESLVRISGQP
jgi:HEAT repeat protein